MVNFHGLAWTFIPASLIFMTSSGTYSLVTLIIDSEMMFLQLVDAQTYVKYAFQTRVTGNPNAWFKMAESLFVHIYNISVC